MTDVDLSPAAFFDLSGFAHRELFDGVETVWQALDRLRAYLAARPGRSIEGDVSPDAYLVGDGIHVGRGTVVEPSAYLRGPCIIGRDCEVRHGAYVRGEVVTGDRCIIGHATEVKGSILFDGAKAGHFAYVGDSILGRGVNLGAGTKLANLRLDRAMVPIAVGETTISSDRRKLGAILGDGVEAGCNSVLNPGTLLAPRVRVWPCAAIGGYHPAGSLAGRP